MNIFHLKKLNQCYLTRCIIRGVEEHSEIDFRENFCCEWERRSQSDANERSDESGEEELRKEPKMELEFKDCLRRGSRYINYLTMEGESDYFIGQKFVGGKVTKFQLSDEYFSPTKVFPTYYFPRGLIFTDDKFCP